MYHLLCVDSTASDVTVVSTARSCTDWLLVLAPSSRHCIATFVALLCFTDSTSCFHTALSLARLSRSCHLSVGESIRRSPSFGLSQMCLTSWSRSHYSSCCLSALYNLNICPSHLSRRARIQLIMLSEGGGMSGCFVMSWSPCDVWDHHSVCTIYDNVFDFIEMTCFRSVD